MDKRIDLLWVTQCSYSSTSVRISLGCLAYRRNTSRRGGLSSDTLSLLWFYDWQSTDWITYWSLASSHSTHPLTAKVCSYIMLQEKFNDYPLHWSSRLHMGWTTKLFWNACILWYLPSRFSYSISPCCTGRYQGNVTLPNRASTSTPWTEQGEVCKGCSMW